MPPLFVQNQESGPPQTGDRDLLRLRAARDTALQATREAIRDTTRLTRLISILNDSGPLDILLDKVLATLSELFLADIVVLLDPVGTGSYAPLAAIGLPEDILPHPFSDKAGGLAMRLMQTAHPVLIENAAADPALDFQLRDMGAETIIGLPVNGDPSAPGVLILARCRPAPFRAPDIDLLAAMAYRIGRTLLETQRNRQFEELIESGREMNRHLNGTAVAAEAARSFPVITHADASALILGNVEDGYSCAAQNDLPPACIPALCALAQHLIGSSLLPKGRPYITANLAESLAHSTLHPADIAPVQAFLALPLHRQERIIGIVFALRFAAVTFNAGTSQIASISAAQISAALENSDLYQDVQDKLIEGKRLEEERRQWERQQRQLQKAESLNRMAGAIAHNFNNMLHAVTGNLELALLESPPDPVAQRLHLAMKASRRAAEISSLMLTYLGQSLVRFELLDLSALCRSSLPLLTSEFSADLTLETDLPAPGPVIKANANQIQQVLRNMMTNARESIGDNRGTIHLAVRTVHYEEIPRGHRSPLDWQSGNDTFACLEVKDNGSGISDSEVEQIFDPFYSTKFTGRGLGLPVVLGIVRAHQGVITVESAEGKGSAFRTFFPLSTESLPRQPQPTAMPPREESGKWVLLIDDEEIVRSMAVAMLRRLGFAVIEAKDGLEAVDLFRRHRGGIDIVLCDLTMPRMDGWETIAALEALQPGIPVVLASGYDEAQAMQGDHPKQPRAFLHKPYQLAELKSALRLALSPR